MTPASLEALINQATATHSDFNSIIYLSLGDAVEELQRRRTDATLQARINELLEGDIPPPMQDTLCAVLFRQIATSNYEIRRFFSLIEAVGGVEPVFFEYANDKFVSNNPEKHAWGKLLFYGGQGKKGGAKIESNTIIDFNVSNGKPICEVKTLWGQPLTEFHHELFKSRYRDPGDVFFDASQWFAKHGGTATGYYYSFLLLFVRHGILFENFLLDSGGIGFTKEVFLPAWQEVCQATGVRPLIVNTEPTEVEGERFWMCHPEADREYVLEKLKRTAS